MNQKTISRVISLLALILVCPQAFAIFDVAPTDKSQAYLGLIFGGSIGTIYLSSDYNATLSMMFEKFNFIILTVGVLVISYIGVVSTINTAREGQALGSKMSMWVPMRAFLGMLLMVPGPATGYSVIQMTVMWIVLNGIGAANSVWSVILEQLARGVPVSATGLPGAGGGGSSPHGNFNIDAGLIQPALWANVCMKVVNNSPQISDIPGVYQEYGPATSFVVLDDVVKTPSTGTPTNLSQRAYIRFGLQGASLSYQRLCGEFIIDVSEASANESLLAQKTSIQVNAVQAALGILEPIADKSVQYAQGGTVDWQYGYVKAAKNAFDAQLLRIKELTKGDISLESTGGKLKDLRSHGWIHAGSFYYSMVNPGGSGSSNFTVALSISNDYVPSGPPVTTPGPTFGFANIDGNTNLPSNGGQGSFTTTGSATPNSTVARLLAGLPQAQTRTLETSLAYASSFLNKDDDSQVPAEINSLATEASSGFGLLDPLVKALSAPVMAAVKWLAGGGLTDNNDDPLISLSQFGSTLMFAGELATLIIILMSFVVTLAVSVASCMNPLPYAAQILFMQFAPMVYGICIALWSLGATMGVYLPLVPYIIFTGTAFGWMISVVEAVVGAPIVALALAHPSGDEVGRVGSPLVILANVFLRPTLMIFGLVLGAGLLRAGITYLNNGFLAAVMEGTTPTMFSGIAVLGVYAGLMTAFINKSFSLIYLLPNQIMRWMGGPSESSDVGQEMQQSAKSGHDSGAQIGQSTVQGLGDSAVGGMEQAQGKASDNVSSAQSSQAADAKHQEMLGAIAKGPQGGGGGEDSGGPAAPTPPAPGGEE